MRQAYFSRDAIERLVANTEIGRRLILCCKDGFSHLGKRADIPHRNPGKLKNVPEVLLQVARIMNENFWGEIYVDHIDHDMWYVTTLDTFVPENEEEIKP